MVKSIYFRITIGLFCASLITSCGFSKSFWGEKAPPRKIALVKSEPLPDLIDFFSEQDDIAKSTLAQYEKFILKSFDQVEGKEKNKLSIEELLTLGRTGLAKLSNDQELSLRRIRSILAVLGFKDGISREQIIGLINWAKDNRKQAKSFYDTLINYEQNEFNSSKLIDIIHFTGSLIKLGGTDRLSEEELRSTIEPWIPQKFPHAIKALPSGITLINEVFGSLCGDRIEIGYWNAKKNGDCLIALTEHFSSTAPVFDLIFKKINPLTKTEELNESNRTFVSKFETWLKDHHHPAFKTKTVADFAKQLEIPEPYHFFQLTEWIPKLNPESTAESFSPTFFITLSKVVHNWIDTFQKSLSDSEKEQQCYKRDWSKCEFKGKFETVDRLFNDEYATLIRVKDMGFVFQITLYDSIAHDLLTKLDQDQNGLLEDDITDLITIIIRLLDSNAFAQNVVNRILEKPVTLKNTEASMNNIKRHGLAEVAALASELIPDRDSSQRTAIRQISSQVYDTQKYHTYALDRLGITTFLYVFNLLMELRQQALDTYDFEPESIASTTWIKRKKIMELMPRMLRAQFPRIYNECITQGFERTCGVIYSEVLASPEKGSDSLEPFEIDTMNLTSILLESIMNRCDRNKDDKISTSALDGFDEKDCVISISQTLVTRLMNANILDEEKKTRTILKIVKWLPPVKWAAKVALQRGTMNGISWRAAPPFSLASRPATLGSIMSLAAEFMDPAKSEAIDNNTEGPQTDAGDELIYMNRLTKNHIPGAKMADRTSAAFKASQE